MEKVILNAEIREELGKSKVKKLRENKVVPAVVYKDGKEALSLKLDQKELYNALHTGAGENVLITLNIKKDKKKTERTCIIKEIQKNPIKDYVIHIDLKEISLTEKIKVKVPIHEHGEAVGVVKDGGVLDHTLWELEIECFPTDIPEKITVEVSGLKIGDSIYVKDLKLPQSVKVLNDPEITVFTVVPPAKEEIVAEAPAEGIEEPEVIAKGKKEEEEIPEEGEGTKKEKTPPAKEDKKA
ncbi:MAG: 50S ribosomal protein L25 [Candidatus Omnitrophica bacterium]|nr:50S ribosomal protein L25 [Candidatus Omnitrophota bacterium]